MMLMMMTIAANNNSGGGGGGSKRRQEPQEAKKSALAELPVPLSAAALAPSSLSSSSSSTVGKSAVSSVSSSSASSSESTSTSSSSATSALAANNLRALGHLGKSSNSSNETVIAALEQTATAATTATTTTTKLSNKIETSQAQQISVATNLRASEQLLASTRETEDDDDDPQIVHNQDRLHDAANVMTTQTTQIKANDDDDDIIGGSEQPDRDCEHRKQSTGKLRAFLLLTRAHLNPFHHHHHSEQQNQVRRKQSLASAAAVAAVSSSSSSSAPAPAPEIIEPTDDNRLRADENRRNHKFVNLFNLAQRCFFFNKQSSEYSLNAASNKHHDVDSDLPACSLAATKTRCSRSAPVTPIKWNSLTTTTTTNCGVADAISSELSNNRVDLIPNGLGSSTATATTATTSATAADTQTAAASNKQTSSSPAKPSVRFVESCRNGPESSADKGSKRRAVHTQTSMADQPQPQTPAQENNDSSVANLFKLQDVVEEGESPMSSGSFRQHGYSLIDYISNYLDTIKERRVTPLNIEPGYLKDLIDPDAPEQGESFANIMHDFENHIMCGITHWQHPHFHAYFPAGNAYPSILADMLSDALGCVGFSWAASPAYTELEIIMLDWMGKMIGLPDEFLCLAGGGGGGGGGGGTTSSADDLGANESTSESSATGRRDSKGGGVIQGSASECVLVNLLAARHWAMEKLRKKYPNTQDGILLTKLIGYCSKEAHSCVEKAAMIGFIRMRALDTDEQHSLRGETLQKAIAMDKANGLEPFLVCATLGTTSCVSFDNLAELGPVCRDEDIWLHVDAAYAGSALICPEFQYLMKGIELVTSFNMNPNKWMLINFDCSLMWVKDRFKLTRAFVVDPLYLQHSFSDQAIDYRHWGIPLSRRFRALKLWFTIRNYGVAGLQAYIRNHVRLAKLFEQLIRQDSRFTINNQVLLGLVCFRLIGSNALNQRLLSMINASGKLHMVPASLEGRYVIRFCVCDQNAKEEDIRYAYECIGQFATELFESIRAGKERIRAISQQNTIDVSNVSLHTQQSASADRLNRMAANTSISSAAGFAADSQQPDENSGQLRRDEPVAGRIASPNREAARQYLMASRRNSHALNGDALDGQQQQQPPGGAKSPLQKQASLATTNGGSGSGEHVPLETDHDDLEQEIVLDSLASIDGYEYDLEDDDDDDDGDDDDIVNEDDEDEDVDLEASPAVDEGDRRSTSSGQPQRPSTRRRRLKSSHTMAAGSAMGGERDEAEDEVFHLAKERRNRMSLRYKREFFVRVVSDPRVYRASISGDINASCNSLGNNQQQQQQPLLASAATTTTSVPHQSLGSGDPQTQSPAH